MGQIKRISVKANGVELRPLVLTKLDISDRGSRRLECCHGRSRRQLQQILAFSAIPMAELFCS
jgi:hypothetical protein